MTENNRRLMIIVEALSLVTVSNILFLILWNISLPLLMGNFFTNDILASLPSRNGGSPLPILVGRLLLLLAWSIYIINFLVLTSLLSTLKQSKMIFRLLVKGIVVFGSTMPQTVFVFIQL